MTSIPSFLLPFSTSGASSASQSSGDQFLLDQLTSQNNQGSAGNTFGDAVSVSLSDMALSMFGGGNTSGNGSASDILSTLTYSNFSTNTSSQGAPTSFSPVDTGSTSFAEQALADGGPLPAFLLQVDAQMHLNPAQQQSLQNIATQYQNASDTPDTVQSIAGALQQAGI